MADQPSTFQRTFQALENAVFADGALSAKTKELIAFAAAYVTQSPSCIHGHTRRAIARGATEEELVEAMWVATVMRAAGGMGGAGAKSEAEIKNAIKQLREMVPPTTSTR